MLLQDFPCLDRIKMVSWGHRRSSHVLAFAGFTEFSKMGTYAPSRVNERDGEILAGYIGVLRQRLDEAAGHEFETFRVSQAPSGAWLLGVSGQDSTRDDSESALSCGPVPRAFDANSKDALEGLPYWRGRACAERLAEWMRKGRRKELAPWREFEHEELSEAAQALLNAWRRQWERLRAVPLRRCAVPGCRRYFVARTRGTDCAYCRRRMSKATRYRHRKANQKREGRARIGA